MERHEKEIEKSEFLREIFLDFFVVEKFFLRKLQKIFDGK